MEDAELGCALRRWRDAVRPADVGLPAGGRRRAGGLRREELAGLAGISVDYLTRLEQGRATTPSAQVVEALARGLRLADSERGLLFELAGLSAPGPDLVPHRVPPSVHRLLDRLTGAPVVVYDAAWDLVVANAPYDALMGPTSRLRGNERNGVWRNLMGSGSRTQQTPQEHDAQVDRLVADLRVTALRYPRDPRLRRLVSDLRAASPRFVELWSAPALPPATAGSRRKTVLHPTVGPIVVDCDTLVVAADDLRIMLYTAEPGTPDADRLELAIVLGTQTLTGQPPVRRPTSGRDGLAREVARPGPGLPDER